MNFSNSNTIFDKFGYDWKEVELFLNEHKMDGVEIILHGEEHINELPSKLPRSMHLRYYPSWLHFWKGDLEREKLNYGSMENIKECFGGLSRQDLVDIYKNEFRVAKEMKAEYMVFHVSHVDVAHTMNYEFDYTDKEVIDASIELINEVFDEDSDVTLLFENLWWPGLTFLNKEMVKYLYEGVNYKNKGFMLDLSHLMITNQDLKTEDGATEYIVDVINNLGELKEHILGLHINKALPGEYMKKDHKETLEKYKNCENSYDQYCVTMDHIKNIDWHVPFESGSLKKIIELVNPKYKVYEVITSGKEELSSYLNIQNKAIGR